MQAELIVLLLLAYLLGSIPAGVWVGKVLYKKDIRQFGSGNSGTTNAFRVLGKKAGIIVLLIDVLKGTAAGLLPIWFGVDINPMIIGLGAIIGHVFPIFAKFKGGKAVATSAGVALAYNPVFLVSMLALFLLLLYVTSMVSFASVTTMLVAFAVSLFLGDWIFTLIVFVIMVLVVVRHKDNIKRIREGTENKVPFGLGSKKTDNDK